MSKLSKYVKMWMKPKNIMLCKKKILHIGTPISFDLYEIPENTEPICD